MMETKQKYFSPECEIVELQIKGVLTSSPVSMDDPFGGDEQNW